MYWLRELEPLRLALYGLLILIWMVGGWRLAGWVFPLQNGERLVVGISTGFVLFLTLANGLAAVGVPVEPAFWLAAVLVLVLGGIAARGERLRSAGSTLLADLRAGWGTVVALLALTIAFWLIQRGLAIFDEYLHLPLVSTMAAGDIPPHFYLNPDNTFAYHYGLQIFAASLVRQANFFPWSGWDGARAFAIAQTLVLGWVWLRRQTGSAWAAGLGTLIFNLAGGVRWLLVLFPQPVLNWLSTHVETINTGRDTAATLATAIFSEWRIEGVVLAQFPFAFHSGVFVPVLSYLGSTGALPNLTILLLLLLLPGKRLTWLGGVVLALILANLALSAEHLFAILWLALAETVLLGWRRDPDTNRADLLPWLLALGASALLSLVQGGFITEFVRGLLLAWQGLQANQSNAYGFSLRWPPGIYTAHFGVLSIFDPAQLLVLLLELGPVLLLAPLATRLSWRSARAGQWLVGALGLAALVNILFPLLVQYGVDRSITRMPGTALWLWLVLAFPALWQMGQPVWRRWALAATGAITLVGGVVILAVQIANIPAVQYSYFVHGLDTYMSSKFWNRLDPQAEVLDRIPFRAVTVFGRAATAHESIYVALPEYAELVANPDPAAAAQAGYSYMYVDYHWWSEMTAEQQARFALDCVDVVDEQRADWDYRLLFDIRSCKIGP